MPHRLAGCAHNHHCTSASADTVVCFNICIYKHLDLKTKWSAHQCLCREMQSVRLMPCNDCTCVDDMYICEVVVYTCVHTLSPI